MHDIKVIDGNNGCFIAMPSRQAPDGEYKDIVHPLNTETREMISSMILAEFEKAKIYNTYFTYTLRSIFLR